MSTRRNQELVQNLIPDFRPRREPLFAWADACSAYQALPGLRGFWPGSAHQLQTGDTESNQWRLTDQSGNGFHLTSQDDAGATVLTASSSIMVPYVEYDGTASSYFSYVDHEHFDITGGESYINPAGITVGCWFRASDIVNYGGLMTKGNAADDAYYLVLRSSPDQVVFYVDPTSGITRGVPTSAPSINTWYFVAARWDPSTEMKIWLDTDTTTYTSSIPADCTNSSAPFRIGSYQGTTEFEGRMCFSFLCAAALPDVYISTLWALTKPLFGK